MLIKIRCNKKVIIYIINRLLLNTLPNVLVIHLKRFKYDERYGSMIKVATKIPFS